MRSQVLDIVHHHLWFVCVKSYPFMMAQDQKGRKRKDQKLGVLEFLISFDVDILGWTEND